MCARINPRWPFVFLALPVLAGGCVEPGAHLVRSECQRIDGEYRLEAMTFASVVETEGLAGQQLVYKVRLIDRDSRPIKSRNSRYQDQMANVSASKTLMVMLAERESRNVSVTIPAAELEVGVDQLPARAEFAVYLPDGTCLSRQYANLPLRVPEDVREHSVLAQAGDDEAQELQGSGAAESDSGQQLTDAVRRYWERSAEQPDEPGEPEQAPEPPPIDFEPAETRRDLAERDEGGDVGNVEDEPSRADEARQFARPEEPQPSDQPALAPPNSAPLDQEETSPDSAAREQSATDLADGQPAPGAGETQPVPDKDPPRRSSVARTYLVKPGDTLQSIARKHYGSVAYWTTVLAANPAVNPRRLRVGQTIMLPALGPDAPPTGPGTSRATGEADRPGSDRSVRSRPYVVKAGDTLTGIALRTLGDTNRWREIYDLNRDKLASPNRLRIGMTLKLPARRAVPRSGTSDARP